MVAIETEVHGFTVVELLNEADVQLGDEISWDTDLESGAQTYSNGNTKRSMSVFVHGHLISKSAVRHRLMRSPV